jgi:hypothetical protein
MKARMFVIGTALAAAVLYLDRRATRAELAELRAAVPKTRAEQASAREVVWQSPPPRVMVRAPVAEPADPPAESSRSAPHEPAPPKRGETLIEQFAPIHDTLEAAFASEARDGAWAMQASQTANAVLAARLPPRSSLRPADCRSTLCRIESTHDGYASARVFVSRLIGPEGRPWNGAFYAGPVSQEPGNGTVTLVTYLAREGTEMPAIPDGRAEALTVH